jgi:glycosyltransferase involved in cell wall biosynthesis
VRVVQPEGDGGGCGSERGFHVVDVGRRLRGIGRDSRVWRLWWIVAARREVTRQLRSWGPDLLHVHGDAYDLLTVPIGAAPRPATLLTIHGGLPTTQRYRLLASRSFRRADRIIAVSPGIADQLGKLCQVRGPVVVLSSGVDCRFFSPPTRDERRAARAALRVDDSTLVLTTVARLVPVKGLDHFIGAVVEAAAQFERVQGIVVGDGPERSRLEACIRAMRAPVDLIGDARREEVRDALWASDAFLLSSVDLQAQREGSPTALVEAMATGLPIVATAVGGVPALLQEGRAGALVPPGDPRRMAEEVVRLLGSPALADEYRARARVEAEARSWERVAQRVTALAQELCANRQPRWPG